MGKWIYNKRCCVAWNPHREFWSHQSVSKRKSQDAQFEDDSVVVTNFCRAMDHTLLGIRHLNNIIKTQKLSDEHVQFIKYQILQGMIYVHTVGIWSLVNEDTDLQVLDLNKFCVNCQDFFGWSRFLTSYIERSIRRHLNKKLKDLATTWQPGAIKDSLLSVYRSSMAKKSFFHCIPKPCVSLILSVP